MIATILTSMILSQEELNMGIYAINTKDHAIICDKRSNASLMPASTMKVITTAAALAILGEEERFQTHLEYDGSIDKEGVLHGNLYIRGGGDPSLGHNRIKGSLTSDALMQLWCQSVQSLGVKVVRGKVIENTSSWEKARAAPSWLWEDLGNYYGAGPSPLSFHENFYTLTFRPGKKVGDEAHILRMEPDEVGVLLENEVKTGPIGSGDQACIYGGENSFTQTVRGTIPMGVEEFSIRGAIPNPAAYLVRLFSKSLNQNGITILGENIKEEKEKKVFHTTSSPPVKEIVKWTNRNSINLYAEHLLKKMGEKKFGFGSFATGIQAVSDFLQENKLDLSGFHMADGSGLSRKNLVTAKLLVSVLELMKENKAFVDSLAVNKERIKAKSGYMTQTRASCGYSGDIVYAIIINQCLDKEIDQKLDRFLFELSR